MNFPFFFFKKKKKRDVGLLYFILTRRNKKITKILNTQKEIENVDLIFYYMNSNQTRRTKFALPKDDDENIHRNKVFFFFSKSNINPIRISVNNQPFYLFSKII